MAQAFAVETSTPKPVAPLNIGTSVSTPMIGQVVLGLTLVLMLIVGLAWFLKRYGKFQMALGGQMKMLGGLSLGARDRVVILQVGETQLLLGISPGRIQTLHVFPKGENILPITPADANSAPFADRLHDLLNKNGDQHA